MSELCVGVRRWNGVLASGGIGPGQAASVGLVIPAIGDFFRVVSPEQESLGATVAVGARAPAVGHFPRGHALVNGVMVSAVDLTSSPRTVEFDSAVLVRSAVLPAVTQCWVEIQSGTSAVLVPALTTALASPGVRIIAAPYMQAPQRNDILDEYKSRSNRNLPLIFGGMSALVCTAMLGFRRREFALYQDVGLGHIGRTTVAFVSLLGTAAIALVVGGAWVVALSRSNATYEFATGSSARYAAWQYGLTLLALLPIGCAVAVTTKGLIHRR